MRVNLKRFGLKFLPISYIPCYANFITHMMIILNTFVKIYQFLVNNNMKYFILCLLLSHAFFGCRCDLSMTQGEIVQIPVEFDGFASAEIDNISVYRIDRSNPSSIDTFAMWRILWSSSNDIITDRPIDSKLDQFGNYDSYFDNCDLILDWHTGRDTLANFQIKKSKKETKGCHENDPNVRIDQFSFTHKGALISLKQSIRISK
jgi:hypothetical protein